MAILGTARHANRLTAARRRSLSGIILPPFCPSLSLFPFLLGFAAPACSCRYPTKAISNHHSDVRARSLYGVWVTPPAVAFIAYANLTNDGVFDNVERMLFCEFATTITRQSLPHMAHSRGRTPSPTCPHELVCLARCSPLTPTCTLDEYVELSSHSSRQGARVSPLRELFRA